ncbi:MAG: poly(ethylene terephthalate) hydrolase family protein [Gemmatimonadaceae bacterium]
MRRTLPIAALLAAACYQPSRLVDPTRFAPPATVGLSAPDPSAPGSFTVRRLYYGSGTDKRRAEYRDSVTLRTPVVNGTSFIRGADPKLLKERWKYWGFDAKRMPVNGRVWYPEGRGPFPLVLIVHGNHRMTEFSDPGYAYLGELLASRGYILASVDENFLNGNLRAENDARGWMLLQHLVAWRRFNADSASPLFGKVDLTRIALMGHSRGGEAVAVAAAFNRLPRYPDDARVTFNFGFDIRTLVAIAPVDGQYRPADQGTPLTDINYLVLHGAHDSDVSTFMGQRQFQRIRFSGHGSYRKSAIYIYRANHGQFNTTWGSSDVGPELGLLLAKKNLLSGEEQRQAGKVFISAFLDLTLRDARAYEPLFRDARSGGSWLPRTIYLTRYEDPSTRRLAAFEEDVDVTTGTMPGVRIEGTRLATWRELGLNMRSRGSVSYENRAVRVGWTKPRAGEAPAMYGMRWSDSVSAALGVDRGSSLVFEVQGESDKPRALAAADTAPGTGAMPRPPRFAWLPKWLRGGGADSATRAASDSAKKAKTKSVSDSAATGKPTDKAAARAKAKAAKDSVIALDFHIEVETADGAKASIALSDLAPLPPPLTIRLYKWARTERRYGASSRDYDQVPTRYAVPLALLEKSTPGFDASKVRAVRFVFDRTETGSVLIDGIGFERDP